MINENQPCINPIEDQRAEALKHYEEASNAIHHWSSFVQDAIKAYNPAQPHEGTEELYSESQLIEFGNYLLSKGRKERHKNHVTNEPLKDRLSEVSDADLSNWKGEPVAQLPTTTGERRCPNCGCNKFRTDATEPNECVNCKTKF